VIGFDRWRYYAWRYRARRDPEREPDDREQPHRAVRRILWRRRAWGWVAVLGLAGYLALGATLLIEVWTPGGVGRGADPAASTAEWLAVAVGAGALGTLAESWLLGRHESAYSVSLRPRFSPARWLLALAGLGGAMALMIFPVWELPGAVNAWGYVTGAETQGTFVAVNPSQSCSSDSGGGGDESCTWKTDGYLERGHQHVTWPDYMPAGQRVPVSGPLWDWLHGEQLMNGPAAAGEIVTGFFAGFLMICSFAAFGGTVYYAVRLARDEVD
jgi:hypothetical protein